MKKGSGKVKFATHLFPFPSLDLTPSSKFPRCLFPDFLSINQRKNFLRTRNRIVCAKSCHFSDIISFEVAVIDQNVSGVDISSTL